MQPDHPGAAHGTSAEHTSPCGADTQTNDTQTWQVWEEGSYISPAPGLPGEPRGAPKELSL